jgi:hypothetical protein
MATAEVVSGQPSIRWTRLHTRVISGGSYELALRMPRLGLSVERAARVAVGDHLTLPYCTEGVACRGWEVGNRVPPSLGGYRVVLR